MTNRGAVGAMLLAATFGCESPRTGRTGPAVASATACTPITSPPDSAGGQIGNFAAGPAGYFAWTDRALGNYLLVKGVDSLSLIGRDGSGPGEFRMIADIGWRGDTVWASDLRLQRFQMFSLDGALIRSVSPPTRAVFALVGGDTLVGLPVQSMAESLVTIVRFVPGRSGLDTLATFRHPQVPPLQIEVGGNTVVGPQPLAERSTAARSPDASRWCGVEPGPEASMRLACVAPDGRFLLDTTITIPEERLEETAVDEVLDGFGEIPGLSRDKVAAALYVPPHRERVTRMMVADDGGVWLQRSSSRDSVSVWERRSEDGALEATLSRRLGSVRFSFAATLSMWRSPTRTISSTWNAAGSSNLRCWR